MAKNDFSHEELSNAEDKCLCVLLLDTSGSMMGAPIDELNKGLQRFQEQCLEDEVTTARLEVAIITFGGSVRQIQDPSLLTDFEMPRLSASGTTPMIAAIEEGIQLIADRKDWYKQKGIKFYRPWLVLMTDGEPDEMDAVDGMGQRLKSLQEGKSLVFSSIGVGDNVEMDVLTKLSQGGMRAAKLQETNFVQFFQWLSNSIAAITTKNAGDATPTQLPDTSDWSSFSFF